MSLHTLDVPRLRKALEFITDHPDEHDQSTWFSGIVYRKGDHTMEFEMNAGPNRVLNVLTQSEDGTGISQELEQWSCSTQTACLAGHLALMGGAIPLSTGYVWHEGRTEEVAEAAADMLGVSLLDLYVPKTIEGLERLADPDYEGSALFQSKVYLFDGDITPDEVVAIGNWLIEQAEWHQAQA